MSMPYDFFTNDRIALEVDDGAMYFRGVVLVLGPTARMLPLLSPQTTLVSSSSSLRVPRRVCWNAIIASSHLMPPRVRPGRCPHVFGHPGHATHFDRGGSQPPSAPAGGCVHGWQRVRGVMELGHCYCTRSRARTPRPTSPGNHVRECALL